MAQKTCYLDWVPHATNSAIYDCKTLQLSLDHFSADIKECVSEVYFMSRSDGVTLFEITWLGDRLSKPRDRIAIAQVLSQRIKELAGHWHIFSNTGKFATISVAPVELNSVVIEWENISGMRNEHLTKESFDCFWKSDLAILYLKFSDAFGSKRNDRTAIFLLRKQYAKVVNKALTARSIIRNRKFLWFKMFGWMLPVSVVFIFSVVLSGFRAVELNFQQLKTEINRIVLADVLASFGEVFSSLWPFAGMICLGWVLYSNNIKKRRAILQALGKARVYLKYGDIFNEILANMKGLEYAGFRKPVGFSRMISIVDDVINIEKEKEGKTKFRITMISLLFIPQFFGKLAHLFPDLEPIVAFLYYFKGLTH